MQHERSANRLLAATPNILSVLRLGLAGAFPLLAGGGWRAAAILVAGFSDFADGLIARRFGAASWVGGLLDAVADKAFVLTALGVLAVEGRLEPWQVALLLSRDAMVLGAATYAALRRHWAAFQKMPSRPLGKLTTAALLAVLLLAVVKPAAGPVFQSVWLAAVALSVAAACDYLIHFMRSDRRLVEG